jgi:hypothetical protein
MSNTERDWLLRQKPENLNPESARLRERMLRGQGETTPELMSEALEYMGRHNCDYAAARKAVIAGEF